MAMLAATLSFWDGFGGIFGPLLNDYRENGRSVKTNNPPSLLVFFSVFGARLGGLGSSLGECLEQERQDGDQDRQADAT